MSSFRNNVRFYLKKTTTTGYNCFLKFGWNSLYCVVNVHTRALGNVLSIRFKLCGRVRGVWVLWVEVVDELNPVAVCRNKPTSLHRAAPEPGSGRCLEKSCGKSSSFLPLDGFKAFPLKKEREISKEKPWELLSSKNTPDFGV